MANSKCCFGCIDVRRTTELIVSTIIRLFGAAIILDILILLHTPRTLYFEEDTCVYENSILLMCILLVILFVLLLFIYININMKKSMQKRNVQHIEDWLFFHSQLAVFSMIFIGFVAITHDRKFIPLGICTSIIQIVMIKLVKRFYEDEVRNEALSSNVTPNSEAANSVSVEMRNIDHNNNQQQECNDSQSSRVHQIPGSIQSTSFVSPIPRFPNLNAQNPPAYSVTYNKCEESVENK